MPAELSRYEQTVGRYLLFGQIGAGGMATVHVGRLLGPAGFAKLVAIKRLHPHLAKEQAFVTSFLDEARIASRVTHPNVVSVDDVVIDGNEVLLVMDYVHGRALSLLLAAERKRGRQVPPPIAIAIAVDMLQGLHAAHTARDERGRPLNLVHRDISPQNVLVGVDGVARVLDFGIAKALNRLQTTSDGAVKGKLAYMAPERLLETEETASVDIYASGIVIWEMLAGDRYFGATTEQALIPKVLNTPYRHLTDPELGGLDAVLERAFRRAPLERYASCADFARALESEVVVASRSEVADWIQAVAGDELAASASAIAEIERSSIPSLRIHVKEDGTHGAVVRESPSSGSPDSTPTTVKRRRMPLFTIGAVMSAAIVGIVASTLPQSSGTATAGAASATPPPREPSLSSVSLSASPSTAPVGIATTDGLAEGKTTATSAKPRGGPRQSPAAADGGTAKPQPPPQQDGGARKPDGLDAPSDRQ